MEDARGLWKDPRLYLLLGGTAIALSFAWSLKFPCLVNSWAGQFQYRELCYNDIQPLYSVRHIQDGSVPYVEAFNEYPVLTGLFMYVMGLLSSNGATFFAWNAFFLSFFALGTTILLYRLAPDRRRVAFWAAGPPLILYAFHNWDLMAVFFTVLALYGYERGKPLASGAAVAAGASAKLFPALLLPILFVDLVRRHRWKDQKAARLLAGFGGTAALINGPFLLANPDLFWQTYRFHLRRAPNFETPWYVLAHYGEKWDADFLGESAARRLLEVVSVLVGLLLLAGLLWAVYRGRLTAVEGAFAGVLLFVLLNKVFSVQYALWILPFFALLPLSRAKFGAFVVGDAAVYIAIFSFFLHFHPSDPAYEESFGRLALAVLLRMLALGWLLVGLARLALRRGRRTTEEPPAPPSGLSAASRSAQPRRPRRRRTEGT